VQKLWPPLNVADYGSYVADLKTDVDAVYASFAGANACASSASTRSTASREGPVLGNMTTVDEGILKNMGDEALGVVSTGWYSAALDNPDNRKLVAEFRKKYDADPAITAPAPTPPRSSSTSRSARYRATSRTRTPS